MFGLAFLRPPLVSTPSPSSTRPAEPVYHGCPEAALDSRDGASIDLRVAEVVTILATGLWEERQRRCQLAQT